MGSLPVENDLAKWLEKNKIPPFFEKILNKKAYIHTLDRLKYCVCNLNWTTNKDWRGLIFDETGNFSRDLPQEEMRAFVTFIRSIQSLKESNSMVMGSNNPYIVKL